MMGMVFFLRIWEINSSPVSPGSMRSSSTRSYSYCPAHSTASLPEKAGRQA